MQQTSPHYQLAKKFVFSSLWDGEPFVGDAMLALVRFAYSEEEAAIVAKLSFAPQPALLVSQWVRRPVDEVRPILESLASRLLILGSRAGGVDLYAFAPIYPGVFEAQMLRSQSDPDNAAYYTEFARLYHETHAEFARWVQPRLGKQRVNLSRVVAINESLESTTGIVPLGTDYFAQMVDRNNNFALADVCACRREYELLGKGCDKPKDVCGLMGYLADLVVDKGIGRYVSKEEFVEAKLRGFEAGLVLVTDNVRDPMQVCSCCSCCCAGLTLIKKHKVPTGITSSGYEAQVSDERCKGCKQCATVCPADAITIADKRATIDYVRCLGCGLCVLKCKRKAMSMRERKDYRPPASSIGDFLLDRYQEFRGDRVGPVARFTLGATRMLNKVLPISVSGPSYKPKKP